MYRTEDKKEFVKLSDAKTHAKKLAANNEDSGTIYKKENAVGGFMWEPKHKV
jgi:hypothetical protein